MVQIVGVELMTLGCGGRGTSVSVCYTVLDFLAIHILQNALDWWVDDDELKIKISLAKYLKFLI